MVRDPGQSRHSLAYERAPGHYGETGVVEPEPLDYARVLSKLLELLGRRVKVTVRGAGSKPPILLDLEDVLQQTDQVEDAETIGLDPDALRLAVGAARLTLHPDHFTDAVHTPAPQGGWLKLVMGQVEVDFYYREPANTRRVRRASTSVKPSSVCIAEHAGVGLPPPHRLPDWRGGLAILRSCV
jgi:hypothetical protein